ncbi:MAG: dockerin type I repeat-containing protein [Bacilli bacterium]
MKDKLKEKLKQLLELIMKNKKIFIGILTILLVLVIVLVILLDKGTFAVEEDTDNLTITCPDTASGGQEIECSIVLNSVTFSTQGLNASYSVTEGMEFVKFTAEDIWNVYANDSDGFVLVNFDGVTGSSLVGTVKYKIPETASSNEKYKVELVNATIGDGDVTSITFENVYDEIRILSDVNTLDNITLSTGSLDEEFNGGINEHNATVDSEKVTINAIKTDDNSSVSGDIGEVTLHYGTNTFNIMVTSETGIQNTYTLNIYRPYNFSSDVYTYSKENNYIYTKTNIDSTTILSNLVLPTELTGDIKNNNLIISYGDEKLLEINIINITSTKYTMLENIMYIESNLSYASLMNTITLNGVTTSIYDEEGNLINSGVVIEGYKLKVFYNDTLLEEYTFDEEYLSIDNLNVDDANNIIKRIVLGTNYSELLSNITTTGTITVKDKDGNILNNNNTVKTGDVIEVKMASGTYSYTISVLGDLTGTGTATLGDVSLLYRYLKGKTELELYQIAAGDVINNGSIKVNDVSRIYRYYKGKITSMEVE